MHGGETAVALADRRAHGVDDHDRVGGHARHSTDRSCARSGRASGRDRVVRVARAARPSRSSTHKVLIRWPRRPAEGRRRSPSTRSGSEYAWMLVARSSSSGWRCRGRVWPCTMPDARGRDRAARRGSRPTVALGLVSSVSVSVPSTTMNAALAPPWSWSRDATGQVVQPRQPRPRRRASRAGEPAPVRRGRGPWDARAPRAAGSRRIRGRRRPSSRSSTGERIAATRRCWPAGSADAMFLMTGRTSWSPAMSKDSTAGCREVFEEVGVSGRRRDLPGLGHALAVAALAHDRIRRPSCRGRRLSLSDPTARLARSRLVHEGRPATDPAAGSRSPANS